MGRRPARVTGVTALRENAAKLKGLTRDNVFKGLVAGGLLVKKDMQVNSPVRTGNLVSSGYIATPKELPDDGGGFTGANGTKMGSRHKSLMKESQAKTAAMSAGSNATVAVGETAFYALSVEENPRSGAAGYDPAKDKKGLTADRVHSRKGGWKALTNALQGAPQRVKQAIAAAAKLPSGAVR